MAFLLKFLQLFQSFTKSQDLQVLHERDICFQIHALTLSAMHESLDEHTRHLIESLQLIIDGCLNVSLEVVEDQPHLWSKGLTSAFVKTSFSNLHEGLTHPLTAR